MDNVEGETYNRAFRGNGSFDSDGISMQVAIPIAQGARAENLKLDGINWRQLSGCGLIAT